MDRGCPGRGNDALAMARQATAIGSQPLALQGLAPYEARHSAMLPGSERVRSSRSSRRFLSLIGGYSLLAGALGREWGVLARGASLLLGAASCGRRMACVAASVARDSISDAPTNGMWHDARGGGVRKPSGMEAGCRGRAWRVPVGV